MSESDLIRRAQQGDPTAWDQVVQQHQEAVFRLAYLIVGDSDDAQDVAQDALIRAYRSLDRFDLDRPLRPWLLRITTNVAHNQRRSLGRYFGALQRLARGDVELHAISSVEADSTPQREAHDLWQAVRRLSVPDQQIIYLRHFLDCSVDETASVLEIAPGTVKSRLHRALARLRGIIEADFPALRAEGLEL